MNGPRTRTAVAALLVVLAAAVPAVGAAAGGSNDLTGTTGHAAASQSQADCGFPYTATDATGTEVTVEERPERVTTLSPSAAQTMWEVGGKSQVVGLTRFASYLKGADSRVNVSASGFGVSVEKVVGTNPDLVLAPNATSVETVRSLRDAGLTVYHFPEATNVSDVSRKTTRIGRLTGNCEGAAEANAWMAANVETATEVTADVEDVRVLYPLGGGYIAGTDTFIDAMLSVSGGRNVAAARNLTGYPQVSDEVILELAPNYLVVTGYSEYLLGREPYASTPAVENDNAVRVNANWMDQPAPRSVVMGVRTLTRGFHPEAAASADFETRAEAVAARENATSASTETITDTPQGTTMATGTPGTSTATGGETATSTPGFGVALAALALLGSGLLARRER